MPRKKLSPLAVRTAAFAGLVASLGAALTWLLIWTELRYGPVSVNWTVFSVIAALMLSCELLPATWIRYGALTTRHATLDVRVRVDAARVAGCRRQRRPGRGDIERDRQTRPTR